MVKGVQMEFIETQHGSVMIGTSQNSEVITEIQTICKCTNDELKKLEDVEKTPHE